MRISSLSIWVRGQRAALVVAFVVIAAAGVVKWQAGLMPEDTFVPPAHGMPSPNAREYFTAAAELLLERNVIQGNPAITQAIVIAKKHVIEAAIVKLHEGMKYPYMAPQVRSFGPLFPDGTEGRDGLRFFSNPVDYDLGDWPIGAVLSQTGQYRAKEGDWSGAMEAYLDALEVGSDLPHGAPLSDLSADFHYGFHVRKPAWQTVDHLSAGQAKAAVRRLVKIDANEVTPAQALQEEKWYLQGALLNLFRKPSWRSDLLETTGNMARPDSAQIAAFNFHLRFVSPRAAYDNSSRYWDAWIAIAQMPWPEARLVKAPAPPSDPISQAAIPASDFPIANQLEVIAMNRLLEVRLALRAYRLEHGSFPSSLTDLVPAYLPAVPLDPFSDHQTLRYRIKGAGCLLYSVGPDAVDNGGKPMDFFHDSGLPFLLSPDPRASGDIIAGVNY